MAQDDKGVFWFGTDKGLSSYDGEQWHSYARSDGLLGDSVYAVTTVPGGDVWVGTRGGVTRLGPVNGDN
jgi:ligand-binding sensor domain-containing protein